MSTSARFFDAGEQEGVPYLTMAYIEGCTLAERLQSEPVEPQQALMLVRKIAMALEHAHARGVVHRDLKPANIMIDRSQEPIVMDFGLARVASAPESHATQSGHVLGTPAYMPPEQVNGELDKIGPASDIYSLGVVLYHLLTGQLPFSGTAGALYAQILTEEPTPPSEHRPDLDPALEAICLKAIKKEPESRFSSMAEFAETLTGYLSQAASSEIVPDTAAPLTTASDR